MNIIIDATTGQALDPSNLYLVEATEDEIRRAEKSNDDAFALTQRETAMRISLELLEAVRDKDHERIGRLLRYGVEKDNTGQTVLYCDDGKPE